MLNDQERQRIEELLLRERKRALEAVKDEETKARGVADDGDLTNYPLHQADAGTDTQEQEKAFLLAEMEGRRLTEIDDALRRLREEPEEFGVCDRCGETISMARLEAIPTARFCADCQRIVEGEAPAESA
ncbi:hypothetical protein BH23GEM4_BH23GEM4_19000 [soil metagenome]